MELNDLEPVEKVSAKSLLGHHAHQIPVGGGDHSDVHRDALVPSHPCELPILEEAQQFGLHLERQLSHLVEQERAAVCYFQPSQPPFLRPGEGSPLMAEHFTLEERDRYPGTIDHSEGLRGPRAAGMDQPRHEFLPRTSLTGEQDWDIGWGHHFDEASQLEHFRVRADERRQARRQSLRRGPPGSTPAWLVRRRSSLRYLGVSAAAAHVHGELGSDDGKQAQVRLAILVGSGVPHAEHPNHFVQTYKRH